MEDLYYASEHGSLSFQSRKNSQNPPSLSKTRRRNRVITSCLECRRRKLKCDKIQPCSNCKKFSRECVFLAPALDSAAQLRLVQIKEKMENLEKKLEEDVARKVYSAESRGRRSDAGANLPGFEDEESGDEFFEEHEKNLEPSPLALEDAAYCEDADDDLMDLGVQLGRMRITERIGGFVRPIITEELTTILRDLPEEGTQSQQTHHNREIPPVDSIRQYLAPGPCYIAPSSSFFFSHDSQWTSFTHYMPSQDTARGLISHYWDSVHPFARILHRPSFEKQYARLWKDIMNGIEPTPSFQAIVQGVFLSAVISMPEENVSDVYGVSKSELVDNYRRGTEAALSKANFIRTTKLETIQAFVMYLIPLCRSEVSRAHSALTGTAIRLAECMGLHRDGSNYGLSPVEVHVRRLIWYQLCFLDIRTCEASGPRPQIRKEDFDTRYPLNVDDSQFDLAHPPYKDEARFTEMTLSRMRFECTEIHRMLWFDRNLLEKKKTTIAFVRQKIQNFCQGLEKTYFPYINKAIPLHNMAYHTYRVLSLRMYLILLHRYFCDTSQTIPDRLMKIMLSTCTVQLESSMAMETDPALAPCAWYHGALSQYHSALLLLNLLPRCQSLAAEDLIRIWRCLDYAFGLPPDLTATEKTRFVYETLLDRTEMYQSLRKMRAPTSIKHGEAARVVAEAQPVKEEVRPNNSSSMLAIDNRFGPRHEIIAGASPGSSGTHGMLSQQQQQQQQHQQHQQLQNPPTAPHFMGAFPQELIYVNSDVVQSDQVCHHQQFDPPTTAGAAPPPATTNISNNTMAIKTNRNHIDSPMIINPEFVVSGNPHYCDGGYSSRIITSTTTATYNGATGAGAVAGAFDSCGAGTVGGDMIVDIDWNELDKFFPQDYSSTDLLFSGQQTCAAPTI